MTSPRRRRILDNLGGLFRPMWMSIRHSFIVIPAVGALLAGGAAEAQNAPAAQRVLDRARNASGGASWNLIRGVHETGEDGGQPYEAWFDPLRFGARIETRTPAGKHVQGYNGQGEWRILANGLTTGSTDRAVLARTRSDAFFGAFGWFYPSRFDVRSTYVGVRQSQGRAFNVLRVQPLGGQPRELWFDRKTGLLGRMVDASGVRPLTVEISDYRKVGPVLAPFRAVAYGADLPAPRERRRESIDFRPADRSLFSLPGPTKP
jgi:hypothetical protein